MVPPYLIAGERLEERAARDPPSTFCNCHASRNCLPELRRMAQQARAAA